MDIKEKNRKQYKRPQINQVNLEIEEAVLANCKLDVGQPGLGGRTCDHGACKKDIFGS
jgi:hypothetical protein